jgi:putative oxidoreductase
MRNDPTARAAPGRGRRATPAVISHFAHPLGANLSYTDRARGGASLVPSGPDFANADSRRSANRVFGSRRMDANATGKENAMVQLGPAWSDRALSVLRIVTALLFLQHGLAKHFGFPHVANFDNLQPFSLIGLAGGIEIVGGLLLLLGLFTRPAAFIMSGEMAVAYFMAHAPRGFFPLLNQGELAVLYCFVFLFLAIEGGGSWSLDAMIRKPGARTAT